jgi:HxlR-like helix-turn-helix
LFSSTQPPGAAGGEALARRQYQSSPPRHDYHLTAAGRELVPVMHALRAWGDTWAVVEPPLRAEHHGHPISPYVGCATCGEPVREGDLEFISTVPDWDITGPQPPAQAPGEESSATA